MKLVKVLSIIALSGMLFSSCSTSTQITNLNVKKTPFYTTKWNLVGEDNTLIKGFNGENVSISFDEQQHTANGYAGCNHFSSSLIIDETVVKFGPIASTKMACPSSKVEDSFLKLLKEANRFDIKGKELYLYKNNILLLKLID